MATSGGSSGITCGADCSETYAYNTSVQLTATASTGYTFGAWTGACSGTVGATCTIAMSQARTVGAVFTIQTKTLTVTSPSDGTITGLGINCPGDCTETYDYGTSVTLTATPATGYALSGWGDDCSSASGSTSTVGKMPPSWQQRSEGSRVRS